MASLESYIALQGEPVLLAPIGLLERQITISLRKRPGNSY